MRYDFDPQIAKDYGVEEAIMYSNIVWWCHKNASERSETHFKDGNYWTWNNEKSWTELFSFWNVEQVNRILKNLTGGVSKKKKAKKGESGISKKLPPLLLSCYVGFKKQRWLCPVSPEYRQLNAIKANANIREGNSQYPSGQMPELNNKEQIVQNTETQGATRRSRSLKKSETYETQEGIPGIQDVSENQRSLIHTLYELGWRWPKSKTPEEFGKSVKSALLVSGIAYHTTQGTFGINQNLFDSELGSFKAYYEAKPTANPLSAFLGWMNRRAKK